MPYWVVTIDAQEYAENACKDVYTCRAKRNVGRHWFADTGIGYWWIFWVRCHGRLTECSLTLGFVKGVQLPVTVRNTSCFAIVLAPVLCSFYYFVQWPSIAQLIDKLLHCSYMFWHYRVITRLDTRSDSVRTGPARRQHHHTHCIYSHYTGLHYNEMILAILL